MTRRRRKKPKTIAVSDRMLSARESRAVPQDAERAPAVDATLRLLRSDAQPASGVARMIQLHGSTSQKPPPAELNSEKNRIPPGIPDPDEEDAKNFDRRMRALMKARGIDPTGMGLGEEGD